MTATNDGKSPGTGDALEALQAWFSGQCDGDWEHSFGVKVETIDNPGWLLTVDLAGTTLADVQVPVTRIERSEGDWIDYRAEGSVFTAAGGAGNLAELVRVFLGLVGRSPGR